MRVLEAYGLRFLTFPETVLRVLGLNSDGFTVPFFLNGLQIFSIDVALGKNFIFSTGVKALELVACVPDHHQGDGLEHRLWN